MAIELFNPPDKCNQTKDRSRHLATFCQRSTAKQLWFQNQLAPQQCLQILNTNHRFVPRSFSSSNNSLYLILLFPLLWMQILVEANDLLQTIISLNVDFSIHTRLLFWTVTKPWICSTSQLPSKSWSSIRLNCYWCRIGQRFRMLWVGWTSAQPNHPYLIRPESDWRIWLVSVHAIARRSSSRRWAPISSIRWPVNARVSPASGKPFFSLFSYHLLPYIFLLLCSCF